MRVIPVIDLMRGQVVRGIAGRRVEYRPLASRLAADARPATVGRALAELGFREVYLADLDAIGGDAPAWTVYEQLAECGLSLMVDAGLSTPQAARAIAQFEAAGQRLAAIVAGLESLPEAGMLSIFRETVGADRLIFSLDLKAGRPLTSVSSWSRLRVIEIAALALRAGVRRMILLDLASVGMSQGVPTAPLCRALRCLDAKLEIIGGGGVRGEDDLRSLQAAGCSGALVASALHDGRLDARGCAKRRG